MGKTKIDQPQKQKIKLITKKTKKTKSHQINSKKDQQIIVPGQSISKTSAIRSKKSKQDAPKQEKTQKTQQKLQLKMHKSKSLSKDDIKLPLVRTRSKQFIEQTVPIDYSLKVQNGKRVIKLHSTYQIDSSHQLFKTIQDLFYLFLQKQKRRYKQIHQICNYSYFPAFQYILKNEKLIQDKCSICQFQFQQRSQLQKQLLSQSQQDIIVLPCSHILHSGCLRQLISNREWAKCPMCFTIYGRMVGDQPPGTMTCTVYADMHCDGHQDVGTIEINYRMHSGVRAAVSFPGTSRTAYLPDCPEGREVCALLKEAFDRKLIFTVGRSVTTGRDNQIVWNGIHHKTNTCGGSTHFGYPDETYFQRVKLELAAKGIR